VTEKNSTLAPRLLPFAEANAALNGALSGRFLGDHETILLFEGDLTVEGDFRPAIRAMTDAVPDFIVVAGDLTVSGRIELYDYTPGLYVGGFTRAETLEGGDCEIYINDGVFTCLVYGSYNNGTLETGEIEVPWVINNDHDLRVTAPNAIFIDNYGSEYGRQNKIVDFDRPNFTEAFVPEVLDKDDSIDVSLFLERLRMGLPVLRPGVRTVFDDVEAAAAAGKTELDLAERKLKSFPTGVLTMPYLKKLVLDGNPIKQLPDKIGMLTNLECLSAASCDLCALPDSIYTLSALKIINLAYNNLDDATRQRLVETFPQAEIRCSRQSFALAR
jgi:hypothetical protein